MSKKPKGFGAFDKLMRKLAQVPPSELKPTKRKPKRRKRK